LVSSEASKCIKRMEKGGDGESRPLGRGCGRRRRRGGGWWTEAGNSDEVGRPRDGSKRRALVTARTDLTAAGGRPKPPRGGAAPSLRRPRQQPQNLLVATRSSLAWPKSLLLLRRLILELHHCEKKNP